VIFRVRARFGIRARGASLDLDCAARVIHRSIERAGGD